MYNQDTKPVDTPVVSEAREEPKTEIPQPENIPVPQIVVVEEIKPEDTPAEPAKIEEAEIVEEKPEEVSQPTTQNVIAINDENIYAVRTEETGDKVYAIRKDKRYWIKNPETLIKMGFYLGKEKKLPFSELLKYSEGDPLDLTVPNPIYPWDKPETPKSEEPTSPFKIWQ